MKGAIVGDIISSIKTPNNLALNQSLNAGYLTYSDSTVMTLATAHALLNNADFLSTYRNWGMEYSHARRSVGFNHWLRHVTEGKISWRHGAALRISPIGLSAKTLEQAETDAEQNASLTHESEESICGAKAVSAAIFLAKVNTPKDNIEVYIEHSYGYRLADALTGGREENPVAKGIANFIYTESFEEAMEKSVTDAEDSEVVACITGAIAHAFYKDVPKYMVFNAFRALPLELVQVMARFDKEFTLDF